MTRPSEYDRICPKIRKYICNYEIRDEIGEVFIEYIGTVYEEVLLEYCVTVNKYKLLEYLFTVGYNPDKKITCLLSEPMSLLHIAIFNQDYDMLEFLLKYVKDINFLCYGKTPLQWAEEKSVDPMMEIDESVITDMVELLRVGNPHP